MDLFFAGGSEIVSVLIEDDDDEEGVATVDVDGAGGSFFTSGVNNIGGGEEGGEGEGEESGTNAGVRALIGEASRFLFFRPGAPFPMDFGVEGVDGGGGATTAATAAGGGGGAGVSFFITGGGGGGAASAANALALAASAALLDSKVSASLTPRAMTLLMIASMCRDFSFLFSSKRICLARSFSAAKASFLSAMAWASRSFFGLGCFLWNTADNLAAFCAPSFWFELPPAEAVEAAAAASTTSAACRSR